MRILFIFLFEFTICLFCQGQKVDSTQVHILGWTPPASSKTFMLSAGGGIGIQWINITEQLNNVHLGNKYQLGGELEFSSDFLRRRRPPRFSYILNYGVYFTHEKNSYQTYYDTSGAMDFSHYMILNRIIPSFSLKIKWNTARCQPYIMIGTYGKNIQIRKYVNVSQNGMLYFSSDHYDVIPFDRIVIATLGYAIPGIGILVDSHPYFETGICFPKYPNVTVSTTLLLNDYIDIFGYAQKNYITFANNPEFERIFLMRSAIMFKLKMRLI